VPNLDVVTCGPTPPNPAELLHAERFRGLIAECAAAYDWVLLDSPPISAVTDPAILGNVVDGVLLIIKAGATSRHAALQARRQLEAAKSRILGVVLNEVDLTNRAYGYYYYHRTYARYGQYRTDSKAV
jgi:polysaccharide biosynthesis transport protein